MNSLIFLNAFEFFQNFFTIFERRFTKKKIETVIIKLLVQSAGKFASMIRNLVNKKI